MPLNTLIVDDEPFVRQDLATLLAGHDNIRVTGEAGTVAEAKSHLKDRFFDLVFLDIRLRGGSGFDLVPFIDHRSKIVFITGYDEYAIKAFELNALDYLLKPVEKRRLANTIGRMPPAGETPVKKRMDSVFVKLDSGGRYVLRSDIAAISSIGGNYLKMFLRHEEHLLCRGTLKHWARTLPPSSFIRIHRSTLINTEQIRSVSPLKSGAVSIRLSEHTPGFTTSRRMADQVMRLIESNTVS
jgi:two-component system LytT family response regulator